MKTQRFAALFSAVLIAALPLQVKADATSELIYAMRNTFTQDFKVSGSGDVSVSINALPLVNGEFQYQAVQNSGDLHSLDNYDFAFDTQALQAFDPTMAKLAGRFAFGSESFYQKSEEKLYGKFKNPLLEITSSDNPQIAQTAEGIAEILKFFADKYITLDLDDLVALFSGDSEEMQLIRGQFEALREVYADYGNMTADLFDALLSANLFDIARDNGAIVLTLTDTPEQIELENLAPILETMGVPSPAGDSLAESLEAFNAELQSQWEAITDAVDMKIRFTTDGGKLTLISFRMDMKSGAPLAGADVQNVFPFAVSVSMSGIIEDDSRRVTFPQEPGINFNKIMGMVKSLIELAPTASSDEFPEILEEDFEVPTDVESVPGEA